MRLIRLLLLLIALVAVAVGLVHAEEAEDASCGSGMGEDDEEVDDAFDEEAVLVLTKDNFHKVIKDTEYVLVRLHAAALAHVDFVHNSQRCMSCCVVC